MSDIDSQMLSEYARTRDATAFAALTRRYASLVYGTCLRITRNPSDAEDVTQECFLHLARQAARVRQSLPGWLHAAARSRSLNLLRSQARRHLHEQQVVPVEQSEDLREWQAVQPHLDAAIAALPEELRELVTRHYLCGISQSELASSIGQSQPTISRRLADAVAQLREMLTKSGVTLSATALMTQLGLHAQVKVPGTVTAMLGKMAITGVGAGSAGVSAKAASVVAAVLLIAAGIWWIGGAASTQPTANRQTNMTTQTAAVPAVDRLVLEGVPRIGYNVRTCPFPGALESAMKYMKEPVDYDYVMAVSGGAFRRFFNKDDGGNVSLEYLAPEVYRRVFMAMGYDYTVLRRLPKETGRADLLAANRQQLLDAMQASLRVGRPALGGVAGFECGIVTGYDNNGDVLLGWSYFRNSGNSYYREANWYDSIGGSPYCVIIGAKHDKPSERDTLIATLRWAIELERTSYQPDRPEHVTGLAAYDAWAKMLENDADFPADKRDVLLTRAMIQVDQVDMTAGRDSGAKYLRQAARIAPEAAAGRDSGAKYLRQAARVAPEAAQPLNAAADLLAQTQPLARQLWRWGNSQDPTVGKALADLALRREFAAEVRNIRELEESAVVQMEKALDLLAPVPEKAQLKTPSSGEVTRGARMQVENVPLCIAMRASLNVLGDDMGKEVTDGWSTDHAYDMTMAYSGLAFEPCVHIKAAESAQAPFERSSPEVTRNAYRRALAVCGRSGEVFVRPDNGEATGEFTEAALKKRIAQAIGRSGRPVIIEGVAMQRRDVKADDVGPGSIAVITGYDKAGDVLVGWTTNWGGPSILFEAEQEKQYADWFSSATAVVIFGEKVGKGDFDPTRRMLRQAAEILTRNESHGYLAGNAAYEAWAAAVDDGVASTDQAAADKYARWIDPNIWDLAERRHYARVVLKLIAPTVPEPAANELLAAADEFAAIHDLMWEINRTGGSNSPGGKLPNLGDPAVRKQIGELIRRAADHDATAAPHLAKVADMLGQRGN